MVAGASSDAELESASVYGITCNFIWWTTNVQQRPLSWRLQVGNVPVWWALVRVRVLLIDLLHADVRFNIICDFSRWRITIWMTVIVINDQPSGLFFINTSPEPREISWPINFDILGHFPAASLGLFTASLTLSSEILWQIHVNKYSESPRSCCPPTVLNKQDLRG